MKDLIEFLKRVLSDGDGIPSFARHSMAAVLYFMICWECYLISKAGVWVDIPTNWLVLVTAMWTVAKTAETVSTHITTNAPTPPAAPGGE
jgi:hypothetical protein